MQAGDFLPLSLQLVDATETSRHIRAYVRDASGALITGAPFVLTHVANGLYQNLGVQLPNTKFVSVQYQIYTDAGFTVISPSDTPSVSIFFLSTAPAVGDAVPLYLQLYDNATDKFVRTTVRDATGAQITGSPVDLTHVALGLYQSLALVMPATKFVTVQYIVYDDSGYTVISSSEGAGSDTFLYASTQGGVIAVPMYAPATIIGTLESDLPPIQGLQDQLIQGADRTLVVRLIDRVNGEPVDLTAVSVIEFRFLNADGTVLSLKSNDPTVPVAVLVAKAGKLSCNVTKAQSALLMAQRPAGFTIGLTGLSGLTVVNLPNQLEVVESAV